jgi:hypothetical protein
VLEKEIEEEENIVAECASTLFISDHLSNMSCIETSLRKGKLYVEVSLTCCGAHVSKSDESLWGNCFPGIQEFVTACKVPGLLEAQWVREHCS